MADLRGTATERLAQLRSGDPGDADWLHRQLVAALEGWEASEDQVQEYREAREDY
jgi:hypothetical protein